MTYPSYADRAQQTKNPVAKKLLDLMEQKQTNLCVSADLTTAQEILDLATAVGDEICVLKTHVDIITDFAPEFPQKLRKIANEKHFLIFEDRKFADIGNTVALQFAGGIYQIAEWADLINAHTIVGSGIVAGLAKANQKSGLILLAQMTPEGNLFTPEYAEQTVALAQANPDFVMGFIGSSDQPETLAQIRERAGGDYLILTPGIQIPPSPPLEKGGSERSEQGDSLGQTYNTPTKAIESGSDIIIVGRGIYQSDDPVAAARLYKEAGWSAYQERCG